METTNVMTDIAEILALKQETEGYIEDINPERLVDRIKTLGTEVAADVELIHEYLPQFASQKAGRKKRSLRKKGERLYKKFSKRIDDMEEMREEAAKHMNFLMANRRKAIPMMTEAEAAFREIQQYKTASTEMLNQHPDGLSVEERMRLEDELDAKYGRLDKDAWFAAGELLSESTYIVELISNVLGVMRSYKSNIETATRKTHKLKRILDGAGVTIPAMRKAFETMDNLLSTIHIYPIEDLLHMYDDELPKNPR